MAYMHGAYGEIVESTQQISTLEQGTIPAYIGTAPIHRIKDYKKAINMPILISNLEEAKQKIGFSENDDWDEYTLSAPIFAHFKNRVKPIGPIVVINVLNPDTCIKADNEEITLINNVGYISKSVILESITIEGFKYNQDFKVEYNMDGIVKLTVLNEKIVSPVQCKFNIIDKSKVSEKDIIGGYDIKNDTRKGINNVHITYEELGVIPCILSAPGWNHIPSVQKALIENSYKIGGHWNAICVTDLSNECKSIEDAKEWKVKNHYGNENEKPTWPKGELQGHEIWMSILAIVRMQQTDFKNCGIPYETASNKEIDIRNLIINGNKTKFNQEQGNKLNEKGITTAIYNGGKWVLWGPHMGNYEYGITESNQSNFGKIFDVNIRTQYYLSNDFQARNASLIDSPIARKDIDSILNTEQIRLDSLKADGKILFGKIDFISLENKGNDLVQGNFNFDTKVTNTPPGKALINRIQYTSEGINSLLESEEE